jgi:murein DD-endopeptidase MepM/ murein hydrolase activator NlpD
MNRVKFLVALSAGALMAAAWTAFSEPERARAQPAICAGGGDADAPLGTIAAIAEFLRRRGDDPLVTLAGFDLGAPVDGPVTSRFGPRLHPVLGYVRLHAGVDIAAESGRPVRAAGPGTVTRAGAAGAYGNLVVVTHDERTETRYAHLSVVDVPVGSRVRRGQVVGRVGNTGLSTAPHLHFELWVGGAAIDPAPWLPANG